MTVQERLARASETYSDAAQKAEDARQALAEVIVEAGREGMRQVEIVKVTGYTRESIRQIWRKAGLI